MTDANEHWILWLSLLSAGSFVLSLAALPWLVARLPADYFLSDQKIATPWQHHHPILRAAAVIARNLLAIVLLAGGVIMLFVPGQGLLTMAVGLLLLDYPGKFALEKKIVAIPSVRKGLNWLRRKKNAPPLRIE